MYLGETRHGVRHTPLPDDVEDERKSVKGRGVGLKGLGTELVRGVLAEPAAQSPALVGEVIAALGRLDTPDVADVALAVYPKLEPALRPRVVQLCIQRVPWSLALLEAIGYGDDD